MDFLTYAASKGVKLLKDDINFVRKMIYGIPKAQKRLVLQRYVEKWVLAMSKCESAVKRENAGRRNANLYLLEMKEGLK